MGTLFDITGNIFGRLTVLHLGEISTSKGACWVCKCECGAIKSFMGTHLRGGKSKSCGCLHAEQFGNRNRKHGRSATREYRVWQGMKARCANTKNTEYHNYGGRGISVCDAWLNSFERFKADMGTKPTPAHSLERVDNDGPYAPWNCKWATRAEQHANKRPSTRIKLDRSEILRRKNVRARAYREMKRAASKLAKSEREDRAADALAAKWDRARALRNEGAI